jgi:hypothetical protein
VVVPFVNFATAPMPPGDEVERLDPALLVKALVTGSVPNLGNQLIFFLTL